MTCQKVNLKIKKVKPVQVVNYNINAAYCNVLGMMQCVPSLRNLHNQSTAICQQIKRVNIEVEYFCDNIIYHHPRSIDFFCKYNAGNLASQFLLQPMTLWKLGAKYPQARNIWN